MTPQAGSVSVSELVLVFWVFAIVLIALAEFVAGQGRLARRQRDLVRLREAHRTVELILGNELRDLTSADIIRGGSEALAIRAPRGSGSVCSADGSSVSLRYSGSRRPDPEKDSVLLLVGGGPAEIRAVTAVVGGGCGNGGLTLALDHPVVVRARFGVVFEHGSYHASGAAIRYRLGRAGRQPLTEAFFARAAFAPGSGAAGLLVHLEPHPDSLPHRIPTPATLRIPSRNPLPR